MDTLYFILFLLAAICFALGAFLHSRPVNTTGTPKVLPHFVAIGLLLWVLVPLIQSGKRLGD
jgi:hypothetical protein